MGDWNIQYPHNERRDAAINRQRLLDTALKLFEQHGVEHVSMNQIALEAEIGSATLYRRFSNKSELCLELIRDNVIQVFEQIEAYLQANQGEPASNRLKEVLRLFIRFRERRAELLTGVEDSNSGGKTYNNQQTRSPLYNQLHEIVTGLLDEMYSAKSTNRDSIFVADMLLTAIQSPSYRFQRQIRGYSPEHFLEHLYCTFISG
ncbi:TetR/AcrR family transcriptional regulator [Alicyclobacillus sp. SO9]|uniref:TetR/AcrR family transcriptional regulator n=1 Tax=Alicyclobacillus sp. SO9 TaxID=2665646 RepID=UPI0018E905A5|nr:TetR/AcrR family transcriptional regulator [Alicyclobacillus sp. SO9]QQE77102.1 TetR/AcrR family transcriptional regulator [Alicyclobacillus sp. SO9]